MNNDYKSLVKETKEKSKEDNYYEIYVECDANDADYMNNTIIDEDIFSDELFFLVLCYLNTQDAFGYHKHPSNNNNNIFGHYLGCNGDKFFDWLDEYCEDLDILIFAGMCDDMCHSVTDIEIYHYINGEKYKVELPNIDEIFDTKDEMIKYMNNLHEQN